MNAARPSTASGARRGSVGLVAALLMSGLWATVAPYTGRAMGLIVDVPTRLEVADHVVPGLPVVAVACFMLATARVPLLAALVAALAGLWMTVTHIGLLRSAADGVVEWAAALNMFVPGIATLICAAGLSALAWKETERLEP